MAVADTMTLTPDASLTNWPIHIARQFYQGAYPDGVFPVYSAGGTPMSTQVNVKNRWPDGSLKNATIDAIVPSGSSGVPISITVGQQSTSNNASSMTLAQILDIAEFGMTVQGWAVGNDTATPDYAVSLRDLIQSPNVTIEEWRTGPICHEFRVTDHTGLSDFGFGPVGSARPMRPHFFCEVWRTPVVRVRVGFCWENSLTHNVQHQDHANIRILNAAGSTIYDEATVRGTVNDGTLLTRIVATTAPYREFWLVGDPTRQKLDQNLAYLRDVGWIPYFPLLTLPGSGQQSLSGSVTLWDAQPEDALNSMRIYPNAGSQASTAWHLSIAPWTDLVCMYSGFAPEGQRISDESAKLARNYAGSGTRECDVGRIVNRQGDDGVSKFLYPRGRPLFSANIIGSGAQGSDAPTMGQTLTGIQDDWARDESNEKRTADRGHMPQTGFLRYSFFGRLWDYECAQAIASKAVMHSNGFHTSNIAAIRGRGPTGEHGVISDSGRGAGWGLLAVANAWLAAVDGSVEKRSLEDCIEDHLVAEHGARSIGGAFVSNYAVSSEYSTLYHWARTYFRQTRESFWNAVRFRRPRDGWDTANPYRTYTSGISENVGGATATNHVQAWNTANAGSAPVPEPPDEAIAEQPWSSWFAIYAIWRMIENGRDDWLSLLGYFVQQACIFHTHEDLQNGPHGRPGLQLLSTQFMLTGMDETSEGPFSAPGSGPIPSPGSVSSSWAYDYPTPARIRDFIPEGPVQTDGFEYTNRDKHARVYMYLAAVTSGALRGAYDASITPPSPLLPSGENPNAYDYRALWDAILTANGISLTPPVFSTNAAEDFAWRVDPRPLPVPAAQDPPGPPQSISVFYQPGVGTVCEWSGPASGGAVATYRLQRATGAAPAEEDFATIYSGGGQAFTDTTAAVDTSYVYRVRAENAGGNSDYVSVDITTQGSVPGPPQNFTATSLSAGQVTLSWDAPA